MSMKETMSALAHPRPDTAGLAPLHACLPPQAGAVRLMYDPSLKRPLRLRDADGVKLPPETHTAAGAPLAALEAALQPLSLRYLGAVLDGRAGDGPVLDLARLGQLPRLLYAYAAAIEALQGVEIALAPRLRTGPDSGDVRHVDARLTAEAGETARADPAVHEAVQAYADWAGRTWARCVASTLGPWVLGSGVAELRLAGTFRPERGRQLAVLAGAPVDPAPPRA